MSELIQHSNSIEWRFERQILRIEPWGENSLRVRATCSPTFDDALQALLPAAPCQAEIVAEAESLTLRNGNITATLNLKGQLAFYNQRGELLLEEMWRQRSTVGIGASEKSQDKYVSALKLDGREFKPLMGGKYQLTVRFESRPDERIYGMGQYQQPWLDLKGCTLELAQRNSQASVPFMQSSLGYGLLWNNPAIGEASFAKNQTEWRARVTGEMDYWITAADTVADITRQYVKATGTPPSAPAFISGLWQCKLRYRTQQEVLEVAREYRRRNLPLSVMVIDFFHWPNQGTWCFDPVDWPDPEGMVDELREMGIALMMSVWPTVEARSPLYPLMKAKGWLVSSERGVQVNLDFMGNTTFFDATHPEARKFVWDTVKKNYYDMGIKLFWLDEAEPEYRAYDFDNYRYHAGPVLEVGNRYPRDFAQGFYDGLQANGETDIVNLVRCAWAGSQRFGVLAWSGDVHSSFHAFRNQLAAGLNMGLAGIPWWTTDIGGFQGGNVNDPAFHELLIRWFQWAVFTPVLRMHGYREPQIQPRSATVTAFLSVTAVRLMSCGVTEKRITPSCSTGLPCAKPCARILTRCTSRLICTETRSCVRCSGTIRRISRAGRVKISICLAKIFWWRRLCRPVSVSAMSGCRRAIAGSLSTVSATPVGSISGCLRRWKPSRCLSAKEVHLSSSWWTDVRQVPKNRQFFQ